jgi:hypothetical protein
MIIPGKFSWMLPLEINLQQPNYPRHGEAENERSHIPHDATIGLA